MDQPGDPYRLTWWDVVYLVMTFNCVGWWAWWLVSRIL